MNTITACGRKDMLEVKNRAPHWEALDASSGDNAVALLPTAMPTLTGGNCRLEPWRKMLVSSTGSGAVCVQSHWAGSTGPHRLYISRLRARGRNLPAIP